MTRFRYIFIGIVFGVVLTFGLVWIGLIKDVRAEPDQRSTASLLSSSPGAGKVPWKIQSADRTDETPPANLNQNILGPSVLPTPIPGETLVYFFTADSDATATVLNLLNTDSVAHTVALRGYSYNGVLGYSLNISVPATSIIRLISDSVAAAPPPSWATPAPIITNFTDFTYFASLSLPKGVKVDGYTLFNPGTGTVDPRADQGAIPLRFSSDPATIFLPTVQGGP